jgi:hypothetical protein
VVFPAQLKESSWFLQKVADGDGGRARADFSLDPRAFVPLDVDADVGIDTRDTVPVLAGQESVFASGFQALPQGEREMA